MFEAQSLRSTGEAEWCATTWCQFSQLAFTLSHSTTAAWRRSTCFAEKNDKGVHKNKSLVSCERMAHWALVFETSWNRSWVWSFLIADREETTTSEGRWVLSHNRILRNWNKLITTLSNLLLINHQTLFYLTGFKCISASSPSRINVIKIDDTNLLTVRN